MRQAVVAQRPGRKKPKGRKSKMSNPRNNPIKSWLVKNNLLAPNSTKLGAGTQLSKINLRRKGLQHHKLNHRNTKSKQLNFKYE